MKKLWFPLAVVVFLAGCTPDRTLDSLVPRNALAVVLLDNPGLVASALGSNTGDFPAKALDAGKPWAAAALPANPPGFLLALALGREASDWSTVEAWAREKGGLEAVRFGTYAVLTSPGLPAPALLDPDGRFDLARVRAGGDAVAVYIDVKNVVASADLPAAFRPAFPILPWAEQNWAGLRLGFSARDGGLEVRVATDWKPGVPPPLKGWASPADLGPWTGLLPSGPGFGMALSVPPSVVTTLFSASDPAWGKRWAALAPLLGPRLAFAATPHPEGWSWTLAVEAQDPQAVRQALKTLVAGGDLQKLFPQWALDADTPLIYQDKPETGGVRTQLTLGTAQVQVAYGNDRVAFAGGPGALGASALWRAAPAGSAPWFREAPVGASMVAAGSLDGLGARSAVKVLGDGNVELRVWVDAAGLKTWEERLPQAALGWLSGEGGWTRFEP